MQLVNYLPDRYLGGMGALYQLAAQPLMDAQETAHDAFVLQLDPTTATWGLASWEAALGLSTDLTKAYDYRRTRVISKLRGAGTTTVAMIQSVAESFSNGEVAITEHPEAYAFDVTFVGTVGIPPNLEDLTAAIEEIKPAHLAYTYVYIYNTYGDLAGKTYGTLAGYTYGELREGEIS